MLTASAASKVHPPAKTANRRNTERSLIAQEFVGPVDQGVQCALARHGFGHLPIQPGEALAQPFGNRFDGQRAGLRGGDFDRQRDTVELLADTSDRQNIRVGEREIAAAIARRGL